MSKRAHRDLLSEHREWVDHQYNDPYWVNRISLPTLAWWRWVRQHNRLVGTLWLAVGLIVLVVVWPTFWEGFEPRVLVVLALCFVCGVGLWLQKPLRPAKPAKVPAPARKVRRKHRH